MKRSKLEIYVELLATLKLCGPLSPFHLYSKTMGNYSQIKNMCELLIVKGLVAERFIGHKTKPHYGVTSKGLEVLDAFTKVQQALEIEGSTIVVGEIFA